MARKTLNRMELREAAEAAEKLEAEGAVKKKKATKRKSRAKVEKEIRLRAYWGVFNQQLKRVALFEYHERDAAQKKAEELSTSQKSPHFVRPVKEEITES